MNSPVAMTDHEAAQAALAQSQREVEELREELEETNRGVVALYAELDAQAEQLKKATELKSRFLAYMSHEFRTPISAIRSIARLLSDRMDGPLTLEQEKQVGFIDTTAAELADMVDDLLDLAKIEAGRVDISPAWFEMVDLFSALRGMFRPVLHNPATALIFEEPEGLPKLYTDDRKLSQILRNFISNALKFTPHGEVRVTAMRVGEDAVKFSVADTGIGIAPEHHAAVFDDFSQVDSPVQKRLRGTGLGLSLSRQLAALLGGHVEVASELGKGSVFSVTLPVLLPRAETAQPLRAE
ncbi:MULTISPECIES: sensor histidine kinase KdpD [unclassified Variovorax]|uniref:sensor histidine kinase n=1 Tax=unclassified Variovorax TaxID=663243 RepID=UPI0008BF0F47|nr:MULTISPECIES: ATP-binding protein [unclassified Variovorax]SEK08824.1 Signal transduction histidine kinase [Variovorax sp. OK202]SFD58802.1 Signal transduction histidine kinase [Variovorax sp. OK212]